MPKQVTRRCHWVSQSYLKSFAADREGKRIWRLGKTDGTSELKRIDKVAVKFHLYAPLGPDGKRDDAMEKKLADLESWFGTPLWHAVCNDFPDFKWQPTRKMVALLAAMSWLRTPQQFEFWKSMHRQLADLFKQSVTLPDVVWMGKHEVKLDHASWPAYRDASEEDMKRAWNDWLGMAGGIAKMFLEMRWAVIVSDTPTFITSDNPVLVGDTIGPHRGLRHPETSVTFPLSPTRVLVMDNRHTEPDSQFYRLKHDPASINLLVWRNAIEHMFSPRDPHQICEELIADAENMGFA